MVLYTCPSISRHRPSSFLNRLYWLGVVGFCTLGLDSRGGSPHFSIRLYCFGVVGLSTLGVSLVGQGLLLAPSFLNGLYWFGVVGHSTLGSIVSIETPFVLNSASTGLV